MYQGLVRGCERLSFQGDRSGAAVPVLASCQFRTPEGGIAMYTRRLDLNGLLAELDAPDVETGPQDP